MYVAYKDFIKHPVETLENYKDFYFNSFPSLFKWYYNDWSSDCKLILSATAHKNMSDNPLLQDSANQYFFAASVFFTCLIPQVITRTAGNEARKYFLRATGWPLMSAGLGGIVSAEQWLKESGLAPTKEEADYFKTLLLIIFPWQSDEMKQFVSGSESSLNPDAYMKFCNAMEGKWDAFEREFLVTVRAAGYRFIDGEFPVGYLQGDELDI